MASANDGHTGTATEDRTQAQAAHPGQPTDKPINLTAAPPPPPPPRTPAWRRWLIIGGIAVGVVLGAIFLIPKLLLMLNTVSTDDAYVNSHVTFVAPRVAGQVMDVLVDDNKRVKKGDVLVRLDKTPYQVQVNIKKAMVDTAQADLIAARAQVRGLEALARSQRWQLQVAMEQVDYKKATLRAEYATYESKKATLELARSNLKRGEELVASGGISKEEMDQRRKAVKVGEAEVEQTLQSVLASRVNLGLPAQPPPGQKLTDVPADITQTYSGVRSTLATLAQTLAEIGMPLTSSYATPKEVFENFVKRDAKGDIDRILEELVPNAPQVKQAEAKLLKAQSDLRDAELNLSYCDVTSEIDGVVTRRNVNPGNNVQVGQSLMAVRSLTEIWVDCNFKETQLGELRIGQQVKLDVDMYGTHHEFKGRITGFTMGTGSTLALLPPQNATGNFVKVVQRLPVKVELIDYNPDKQPPLFVGLSVTPYVYIHEPLVGNDPGKGGMLQPYAPLPK